MALDSGISIDTFWNSSLNEIMDMLESCAREEKRKRKEKIMDDFILAEVVAINFASIFFNDGKTKVPKPWDYYEKLFTEEKVVFEKEEREREFMEYQARRKDYFDSINRSRHQ